MYYAYLTSGQNKIYLYDLLDKKMQGNSSADRPEIENVGMNNIYENDTKAKNLLHQYLATLSAVYSAANDLIVKADSTNNYVNDFAISIKKLLPKDDSSENKKWTKFDWQVKRQLFLGTTTSPYYNMFKNMRKLCYCLGEVGLALPFPSVYAYLTNLLRKDYNLPPQSATRHIKNTPSKVKEALNKIDISKEYMLRIQLCSLQEHISIQNINTQFGKISSSLIDGNKLFQQLCKERENLLKHICSVYYDQGTAIYKSHFIKEDGTQKTEYGIRIQKDESQTCFCPICHAETEKIIRIKLFNGHKSMVMPVCALCFANIANKLILEAKNRFSNVSVNNQMMIIYDNYQYPTDVCDCCNSETNAFFTISSAQNPDFKLCKKCFQKLSDKAALKSSRSK